MLHAQTLSLQNNDNRWNISCPGSRLVISIPGARDFRMVDSMVKSRPRYLYLLGAGNGVTISGWYERADYYKGMEEFWRSESTALSGKLGATPTKVAFTKLGAWDTVYYELALAEKVIGVNFRAELLQDGDWIDLHLSKGTNQAHVDETRRQLAELVKQIKPVVDMQRFLAGELEKAVTDLTDRIDTLDDRGYAQAASVMTRYLKGEGGAAFFVVSQEARPWTADSWADPAAVEMLNATLTASLFRDTLRGNKQDQLYNAWLGVLQCYRHHRLVAPAGSVAWKKISVIEKLAERQDKGTLREYAASIRLFTIPR